MASRIPTWASVAAANAALAGGLLGPAAAAPAGPQPELAGPDLECFDTPGASLSLALRLSDLDPALGPLGLTDHVAVVRELVQTCVAVNRRGMPGPEAAVPPVDLACYRLDAAPLPAPVPLAIAHARPVLALLPGDDAALTRPAALCLPVVRDGVALAPDVRRLVQAIALECYAAESAERRPLCLPVAKNSERIPRDVRGVLQRIGGEQLAASRPAAPSAGPGLPVVLHHVNPLLATLPAVAVVLQRATGLMVPVARRAPVAP